MIANDQVSGVSVDGGLRDHMSGIYGLLARGLLVSALSAFAVAATPLFSVFFSEQGLTGLGYAAIFLPLGLLLLQMINFIPRTLAAARGVYWSFVALKGVMLTMLALYFPVAAIIQALAITAAVFGAMSLFGYTTKRDLSPMFAFLMMGLLGLLCAAMANIFLGSPALYCAVSVVGVLVFSGFIAWETQAIKEMYDNNRGSDEAVAILRYEAALSMYISIMGLFRSILNLTSSR